jgi:hypothetical protein
MARNRTASNAVKKGTAGGTAVGVLIEVGAAAAGVPLPPGTGAVLAGALTGLFSYFSRGGRRGESD